MLTITLIGLGPGDPGLLTRAAWSLLQQAEQMYTPTPTHAALAHLPAAKVVAIDPHTGARTLIEHAVNRNPFDGGLAMTKGILDESRTWSDSSQADIFCALPGHPHDHPITAQLSSSGDGEYDSLLVSLNLRIKIVPGISMLDALCEALGVARYDSTMQVMDATLLGRTGATVVPSLPASQSTLPWCEAQGRGTYQPAPLLPHRLNTGEPVVLWCSSGDGMTMQHIQEVLLQSYPKTHTLRLARLDAQGQPVYVRDVTLDSLTHEPDLSPSTALSIPALQPLDNRRSFQGLAYVVGRLLGPQGCPWDVQQTHQSLRTHLLEETHEVLEALDNGDMTELGEELGDLLVQVLIHSEMARQVGHFDIHRVLEHITTKLIRRHPHVFRELQVRDADEVLQNWEQIKAQELAEKGRERTSALDGVPAGVPALAATQKLVKKAIRAGFTWRVREEVWAKLREELDELVQACDADEQASSDESRQHLAEELGDVLFVTAVLAHWLNLDAESTLREANAKFRRRFILMEQIAQSQGHSLADVSDAEKLAFWHAAKHQE